MTSSSRQPFWFNDPSILLKNWGDFCPLSSSTCNWKSLNSNLNAFTRFTIICSLILLIYRKSTSPLYICLLILSCTIAVYFISRCFGIKDSFLDWENMKPVPKITETISHPTQANPLMNPPVGAYSNGAYGGPVTNGAEKPSREVNNKVNEEWNKKLFKNPSGLLFDRVNSQRQWVTVPGNSVPNKQGEFAQWLWGNEFNCKAGSINAQFNIPYDNNSLLCTGRDVSVPTNFGKDDYDLNPGTLDYPGSGISPSNRSPQVNEPAPQYP